MLGRNSICALAALLATMTGAAAFDDAKYPDWKGEWSRIGSWGWDPTKPRGAGQQAPLTAEYQAVLDASLADQARGGQGNYPGDRCLPYGMPGVMFPYRGMEFVVAPDITHILPSTWASIGGFTPTGALAENLLRVQRLFDRPMGRRGRRRRYDTLLIETRGMRGPRSYDSSGMPLHSDNETIVKERITSTRPIRMCSTTRSPRSIMH